MIFIVNLFSCKTFSIHANTFFLERSQTKIQVPINWTPENPLQQVIEFQNWKLIFYSSSFSRGEAFYFEILPIDSLEHSHQANHQLFYKTIQRVIPINKKPFGFNGLYVFPPNLKEENNEFQWKIQQNNEEFTKDFTLKIHLRKYPVADKKLVFEKKRLSKEEEIELNERIQKERFVKKNAFDEVLPNLLTNHLSHPRDYHYVTSEWHKIRTYQYYEIIDGKKVFYSPYQGIHKGVDLRGNEGDLVFSIANGKVVIADDFYFEGRFVLINHGNKVFSGYMHLKDLFVSKDQFIQAGTPIGTVGATGRALGAHLHYSLWIDGFNTDPLSIFSLPIR
ncbi:MAG: M23 family metallopeptidase [Leptospiraceae bacterium]|nr:M23 family metallopeptidase [Leptospiraceae bacterium]MDW7977129.1 M23 family metallopeptidase [Leptospiraceae bacterium]